MLDSRIYLMDNIIFSLNNQALVSKVAVNFKGSVRQRYSILSFL